MSSTYYDRSQAVHVDGSPIFRSAEDEKNEDEIAHVVGEAFGCVVRPFGKLAAIDYYAERDGRLVGVLELKSRTHDSAKHSTVFLNVRKWLALTLAGVGLGVPAVFVVRFTDGVKWITVEDVDASKVRIAGCVRQVKSRSDVEPVIEVPLLSMKAL